MRNASVVRLRPYAELVKRSLEMAQAGEFSLDQLLKVVRLGAIGGALRDSQGSIVKAAKLLGVHRHTVMNWLPVLREAGIEFPEPRVGRKFGE